MSNKRRQRPVRGASIPRESEAARNPSPALQVLAYSIVVLAAILINLSTLHYDFLNWDDPSLVVQNPWIRGLTGENLVYVFTHFHAWNYLPLQLVSYMFDYSLWGLNPLGYHLHAVLLNALNAVLGMIVIRKMTGSYSVAFLAALLFAVHPSHVEAVAWISIRKDLLSTTFLLLSLYFYLRATAARPLGRLPYTASVVCFALGLLSKVSIVVLPLFLLLWDLVRARSRWRRSWTEMLWTKIPYAVLGFALAWVNTLAQVKARAAYAHDPLIYLMVKGHAVWKYLGLLTGIPRGIPIYDTPQLAASFVPVVLNLSGLVVLPAVAWLAYRYNQRTVALGAGWIITLLAPAILFPLVTYMADRYLYAPSLGFCWILAGGIVALGDRAVARRVRWGFVALLGVIPFAGFAFRTVQYNPVWKSSESLWSYAIKHCSDYRAYVNLGQVRIEQHRWAEAERLLKVATRVEDVTAYRCLAVLYYDTKRYAEAERVADKALEMAARRGSAPGVVAEIDFLRGSIYWVESRNDEAIRAWEAALQADPRHAKAREWLTTARKAQAHPAD